MEKQKKTGISGVWLSVALLMLLMFTGCRGKTVPEETSSVTDPAATTVAATEAVAEEMSVTDLMKTILTIKGDLKAVLECMEAGEAEQAEVLLDTVAQSTQTLRRSLNATVINLGESAPSLRKQLENLQRVLDLADMVTEGLLRPAVAHLKDYPASGIRVGDGVRTDWLIRYVDFAESRMPQMEKILAFASTVDLSPVDSDGDVQEMLVKAGAFMEISRENPELFSWIRTLLGADGDRLYLVAAQNSAEIRASGGYPGSMGTIRVRDGVLTLEDFRTAAEAMVSTTPKGIVITVQERSLFSFLGGMQTPRDADLCPDFERVGAIWAAAYEEKNRETVDGVITMTPHIVQRLLAVLDTRVELADGLVLDGKNATKVLQHDIYFKYYTKDSAHKGYVDVDGLFAEAAHETMSAMLDNLSLPGLLRYLEVAKDSIADRTLMVWMKEEAVQSFVVEQGWSGGLNTDPEKPLAGVYFNCTAPSKMGWFLLMDAEMGEPVVNEDGSCTYRVTVTLSNNITEKERKNANHYITASLGGAIQGAAYFFAPAGGSVSDFAVTGGRTVLLETYRDWQLGYIGYLKIAPDQTVTVTYSVTTAPGVSEPLGFSMTPTAQGNF